MDNSDLKESANVAAAPVQATQQAQDRSPVFGSAGSVHITYGGSSAHDAKKLKEIDRPMLWWTKLIAYVTILIPIALWTADRIYPKGPEATRSGSRVSNGPGSEPKLSEESN